MATRKPLRLPPWGLTASRPSPGLSFFTYSGTSYGPTTTPPSTVGTYSVAVLFTSLNSNYANGSAGTTIVITPASASVGVASSANPSTVGGSVSFTATVSSTAGTPTGTVQFVVDGVNFGRGDLVGRHGDKPSHQQSFAGRARRNGGVQWRHQLPQRHFALPDPGSDQSAAVRLP